MFAAANIVDAALILYLAFGARTWGYIFLRTGWPNIRHLEPSYKNGWSIAFGMTFAALMAALAIASSYFLPVFGTATELILISTPAVFLSAIIVFSIKRKFFVRHKVTVSVPKRVVTASIVAKKAMERIPITMYMKPVSLAAAGSAHAQQEVQMETRESVSDTYQPSFGLEDISREEEELRAEIDQLYSKEEEKKKPEKEREEAATEKKEKESPVIEERVKTQPEIKREISKIEEWKPKPQPTQQPAVRKLSEQQITPLPPVSPRPAQAKASFIGGIFKPKDKLAEKPALTAAPPVAKLAVVPVKSAQQIAAEREEAERSVQEAEREAEIIENEIERVRAQLEKAKAARKEEEAKKPGIFSSIFSKKPQVTQQPASRQPMPASLKKIEEPARKEFVGKKRGKAPLQFELEQMKREQEEQKVAQARRREEESKMQALQRQQQRAAARAPPAPVAAKEQPKPSIGWPGQIFGPKEPQKPEVAQDRFEVRDEMTAQTIEALKRRLEELERQKVQALSAQARTTFQPRAEPGIRHRQDVTKVTEDVLKILEKKTLQKDSNVASEEQLAREAEASKQFIRQNLRDASIKEGLASQYAGEEQLAPSGPTQAETALPKSAMLLKQLLKEESG